MKRKALSIFLSLFMILTVVPAASFTVSADDVLYDGDYKYTVINNEATVVGIDQDVSGEIIIPDTLGGYTTVAIGNNAFSNNIDITDVKIPESVKKIGEYAFSGCRSIKDISIPDTVESIGEYAFSECGQIEFVILPEYITEISEGLFQNCEMLSHIYIPPNIEKICNNAFNTCVELKEVSIPASVSFIGEYAFYFCYSITEITIPNNVTEISNHLFDGCEKLKTVNFPANLIGIGESAFNNCKALTDIALPQTVNNILSNAFSGCSGLKSITLNKSVSNIAENAFQGCAESLETITAVPDSLNFIIENNVIISKETKTLILGCKNSVIPDDGSVETINSGAFENATGLTQISIPESITEIGENAFKGCENLNTVNNNSKLNIFKEDTAHGYAGFYAENIVWNFTDSGSCGESSTYSFNGISGTLTVFGSGAVSGGAWKTYNKAIYNIDIGDNITNIGDSAFYDCTFLENVTIGKSVETIGDFAFSDCRNIKTIDNYSEIYIEKGSAFGNDGNIAKYADTVNWHYVDSGSCGVNVTYSFNGISGEMTISGSGAMTDYEDMFAVPWYIYKNIIKSVKIDDGITTVGNYAFKYCNALSLVSLPNSLISLGIESFHDCDALTEITVPKNVISIGENAFLGDENLNKIINNSSLPITKGSYLYGYIGKYATAINWNFAKPENLSVKEVASYSITLTWDAVSGVDGYKVTNKTTGAIKYASASSRVATFTGLNPLASYNFVVQSYVKTDNGTLYSSESSVEIGKTAIGKTVGGKQSASTMSTVTVTWSEKPYAAGYRVLCTTTGKYKYVTGTSCTFTDLTAGKQYNVYVRAYTKDQNGKYVYGNSCDVIKTNTATKPATPTVSLSAGTNRFTAKWGKLSDVNGYEVQYALNSYFTSSKRAYYTAATATTPTGLTRGKTYYVRVRAYKIVGGKKVFGSWSTVKTIKVK